MFSSRQLFVIDCDGSPRLGLVTLEQMLNALTCAVENPVGGIRVLGVPEIRNATG